MAFLAAIPEVAGSAVEAGEAGAEASEAGAAAEESSEESLGGEHNLGGGHSMHISEDQFNALAHSQAVVNAIMDRAHRCTDIANDLAITQDAKYDCSLNNSPSRSRATAVVYAANYKAVVDDAYHSTLLKAAAQTGSDPRIEPSHDEGPEDENEPEGPKGPDEGGEGAEAGEAGEAAAGSELAEVAEVAVVAL
jgi:hypothetical protein